MIITQEIYYAKSTSGKIYRGRFIFDNGYDDYFENSEYTGRDTIKRRAKHFAEQISKEHRVQIQQYGVEVSSLQRATGCLRSFDWFVKADDPLMIGDQT